MSDVTDRLDALEHALKANQLPDTIAVLQRTLEQHWQPDASVLLPAGSIIGSMLGGVVDADGFGFTLGAIRVRWGSVVGTFAGATDACSAAVTHGLGHAPTTIECTCGLRSDGSARTYGSYSGVGTTSFTAFGVATGANPAAAVTVPINWVAIG